LKKAAKTFGRLASARAGTPSPDGQKFFGSFFKEAQLSSACLRFADILRPTWAVTFFEKRTQKLWRIEAGLFRQDRSKTRPETGRGA
jgi:hypothetical protein